MTWASALSDISVSYAGSTAHGGRMMLPDARRKKFRAIEEGAGHADSCLLTRPAGPVTVRRAALAATASACGSVRKPGWWPRSAKHVLPDFDGHSRNVPLKAEAGPGFPDNELAYGTRSNVSIFHGAGAAPAPREFCDIGVT